MDRIPKTCTCDYDEEKFWLGCPYCVGGAWKPGDQTLDDRPSFDDIYMAFASMIAERSTCSRAQVGAVVVSSDNHRVLSLGYNGGPKGLYNECLSDEPGKCGHIHAEINALIKANYNDAVQKKIYTTTSPCLTCATAIINAGISECVYLNEYRDTSGLELLRRAGLVVRRYEPKRLITRDIP